jgi:hypothetical protein
MDEYKEPFTVTAVLKDVPTRQSYQFDLLIPTARHARSLKRFNWSWVWQQMNTYVLLIKALKPNQRKYCLAGKQISSHGESRSCQRFQTHWQGYR